ncbi:MAG: helix-turn-helix domain-containing protein [Rhizobiaceae bacterium]
MLACITNNDLTVARVDTTLATRENIFRLQTAVDLQYDPICDGVTTVHYRDAVCDLCEKVVSIALTVPLVSMQAKTRCGAEIALARQIAMYLCHTTFSLLLTEVGLHFGRDRSTVAHACNLVEDKRDDLSFDVLICQLEALLCDARHAMSICVEYDAYGSEKAGEAIDGYPHYKQLTSRGG